VRDTTWHRVRGFSLLSLLVGLLLGSIAVAASVTFYRVNLRQSVDARATSQQDVESALAMQTVSTLVMQAGFGIRSPSGPSASVDSDFVLLGNAQFQDGVNGQLQGTLQSLAAAPSGTPLLGNAVVWSWSPSAQPAGPVQCAGVVSLGGALLRLAPASCSNAGSGWSSIAWETQTIVANRTSTDPNSSLAIGTVFSVDPGNPACAPFSTQVGRGNTTGVVLGLTDFTSTSSAGSAERTRSFTSQVCLTNIAR
jgi:type II secretory pathway component PulJ